MDAWRCRRAALGAEGRASAEQCDASMVSGNRPGFAAPKALDYRQGLCRARPLDRCLNGWVQGLWLDIQVRSFRTCGILGRAIRASAHGKSGTRNEGWTGAEMWLVMTAVTHAVRS